MKSPVKSSSSVLGPHRLLRLPAVLSLLVCDLTVMLEVGNAQGCSGWPVARRHQWICRLRLLQSQLASGGTRTPWWWDGRKERCVPSLLRRPQDLSRRRRAVWMSAIILAVWQGCIRLERISRWRYGQSIAFTINQALIDKLEIAALQSRGWRQMAGGF